MSESIVELMDNVAQHSEMQETLHVLCDRAGKRWIGSEAERLAGDYLMAKMREYGLANVHTEAFRYQAWQRGAFRIELVEPFVRPLTAFALPNTGSFDVSGEVMFADFGSLEEWKAVAVECRNRVVVCRGGASMGFAHHVLTRPGKARMLMEAGATALIWAGAREGQLPHTGSVDLDVGARLPCVTMSSEDAGLLRRAVDRGRAVVSIAMRNAMVPAVGLNLVGDVPGDGSTDEVVMGTAHYDGHDTTDAAHDNAAGCAVILDAARAFARHGGRLKRTLRFVIFTAEEVGLVGSTAYATAHAQELDRIRFLLNADGVAFLPSQQFIHVPLGGPTVDALRKTFTRNERHVVVKHAVRLNWDHAAFAAAGVPCGSITVLQEPGTVSHWGHTAGDTPEKLSDEELRSTAANIVLAMHEAANRDDWPRERLGREEVAARLKVGARAEQVEELLNDPNPLLLDAG